MIHAGRVAITRRPGLSYPANCPYDPPAAFPEYPFGSAGVSRGQDNQVYSTVRDTLRLAGLDEARFGGSAWNPLGDLVAPGGTVLIKPNWVRHYHLTGKDLFSIITHPSVLRPLIDYAFLAVGSNGRIWVMDAPNFDADFEALDAACQLTALQRALRDRGVPVSIGDMRSLVVRLHHGVVVKRIRREVWESEGIEFDLGADSELVDLGPHLDKLFGSDYDRRITVGFHAAAPRQPRHRYRIAKRALEADLVISVPKLKTHKKTGVTLNVKNMIGINTDKNYIPHYRVGSPAEGGDEFPDTPLASKRFRRQVIRYLIDNGLGRLGRPGEHIVHQFMTWWMALHKSRLERRVGHALDPIDVFYRTAQRDVFRTGNWWGNDTCWRCALDINKLLFYATRDGRIADVPQRRYLSVIDGIVGGDEDGPMAATPRPEGVLLAGFDPISVDTVATELMGFRCDRIRDQVRARELRRFRLLPPGTTITVESNWPAWQDGIAPGTDLHFRPHPAWADYLETEQWKHSELQTSSTR
jgi:uncharacterized protein (DUF362 family)